MDSALSIGNYRSKYIKSSESTFLKSLSAVIKGMLSHRDVAAIMQSGSLREELCRNLIMFSFIS